jgi:hypothetical protein
MIDPTRIDYGQVARLAQDGSPMLVHAVGRIFGLGPVERRALGADGSGVPMWTWALLAAGAGFVIGARVQQRWPRVLPDIVVGR